jgi:hypothetical protein
LISSGKRAHIEYQLGLISGVDGKGLLAIEARGEFTGIVRSADDGNFVTI